jgi:hypothetical protein
MSHALEGDADRHKDQRGHREQLDLFKPENPSR